MSATLYLHRFWTNLPGLNGRSRSKNASSAAASVWDPQRQGSGAGSQIERAPHLASLIECERAVARATMAIARDITNYHARTALLEIAIGQTWFAAMLSRHLGEDARQQHVAAPTLPDELRHLTCVQSIEKMGTATQLRTLALALRRINKEIEIALAGACGSQWDPRLREIWRTHATSAAQCRYLARYLGRETVRG